MLKRPGWLLEKPWLICRRLWSIHKKPLEKAKTDSAQQRSDTATKAPATSG